MTAPCFLGVDRSVTGRRWVLRDIDERQALAVAQRHGLPEIVGRVLAARGVDAEGVPSFLQPALRDSLPDPSRLKDLDVAVERIATAVMQGERIAVFGDYDVDGASSSAIFVRFLRAAGATCRIYIPDRLEEGYGPNAEALLGLLREGISLAVAVDCGTTAHEPLAVAAEAGLDVVVIDHHEAEARLPRAVAIVNPNRLDEDRAFGHLAAVGVTFLVLVGLNRALRRAGWYGGARPEPDLLRLLDIVALGTVCDVVPLHGLNRAFVARGLEVMRQRRNPGLRALSDVARLNEQPGTYHLGFILGPRINAGGRVGESELGAWLLSTDDDVEARRIAVRLDELNRHRQETEATVLDAATAAVADRVEPEPDGVIFAHGVGWHPGVIGIVAGRLAERYNRPACVIAIENGVGTGSGRSIPGVDLGTAIIAAGQKGLLIRGGGHAMAAGFSVAADRIEAFQAFLIERLGADAIRAAGQRELRIDGGVEPAAASMDLLEVLQPVGPFGVGNPEPRFAVPSVRVAWAKRVGGDHVSCALEGRTGDRLRGIAFRCADDGLGALLMRRDGTPIHVAGRLRANHWGGTDTVQMFIDDAAPV